MSAFSFLQKGLNDFAKAQKKQAEKLEAKKTELAELKKLPLPREDFISGVCKMIDSQAKNYPQTLARTLAPIISNPAFDFENSTMDLLSASGNFAQTGTLPKQNAFWFFGDLIKQRISDAIEEIDWPKKTGLPLSKRAPLITKIESEIAALEIAAAELRTQAKDLGISVPAPLTKREQSTAFTAEVARLTEATPYPDHTIRAMLIDGLDPMEEMKKIKAPRRNAG